MWTLPLLAYKVSWETAWDSGKSHPYTNDSLPSIASVRKEAQDKKHREQGKRPTSASCKGKARRGHVSRGAAGAERGWQGAQEGARGSSSSSTLPLRIKYRTSRSEQDDFPDALSAGLFLCLQTDSYKEFWMWRAQEIPEDTGHRPMEDGWGLNNHL